MQVDETGKTTSAAKAPEKAGKGNTYVETITHHRSCLYAM